MYNQYVTTNMSPLLIYNICPGNIAQCRATAHARICLVRVCACVRVCAHACVRACMFACTRLCVRPSVCVYMPACVGVRVCVPVCSLVRARVPVRVCMRVHACDMRVCINGCACVRACGRACVHACVRVCTISPTRSGQSAAVAAIHPTSRLASISSIG